MSDTVQDPGGTPPADLPPRRFTLRDSMLFVIAMALGVVGYRRHDSRIKARAFAWDTGIDFEACMDLAGPGLVTLSTWVVIACLLPPRRPRVELFRQMGFVGAFVSLALTARRFVEESLDDWIISDDWFLWMEWQDLAQEISLGILTVWLMLALAGCLRAGRGWVAWTSLAINMLWVVAGIASNYSWMFK